MRLQLRAGAACLLLAGAVWFALPPLARHDARANAATAAALLGIRPANASLCRSPERLGGTYRYGKGWDGGWDVCTTALFSTSPDSGKGGRGSGCGCVVYSAGAKDDTSFDEAAAGMGCKVESFDPSLNQQSVRDGFAGSAAALRKKGVRLHPYGLGGTDRAVAPGEAWAWPGLNYGSDSNTESGRVTHTRHPAAADTHTHTPRGHRHRHRGGPHSTS